MWADLSGEIALMFSGLSLVAPFCTRGELVTNGWHGIVSGGWSDPHVDADRWLSASPSVRRQIAVEVQNRPRRRVESSKPSRRNRAAYMRAYRAARPAAAKRDWSRVSEAAKERMRQAARAWRAAKRAA